MISAAAAGRRYEKGSPKGVVEATIGRDIDDETLRFGGDDGQKHIRCCTYDS